MADWLKQLERNAAKRAELLAERDQLIANAKADKVPVTHIAKAVGLSAMQVHRIINDSKGT